MASAGSTVTAMGPQSWHFALSHCCFMRPRRAKVCETGASEPLAGEGELNPYNVGARHMDDILNLVSMELHVGATEAVKKINVLLGGHEE